jgi:hypothetical protein
VLIHEKESLFEMNIHRDVQAGFGGRSGRRKDLLHHWVGTPQNPMQVSLTR